MDSDILCPSAAPQWIDFPDIELYMDQVISVLEKTLSPYFPGEKAITSTMINNYVKQKLLPPPQNKRYTKGQITKLFMICILKSFMQLSEIAALLDSLAAERTDEEVYTLFSEELDRAVSTVFGKEEEKPKAENPTEKALQTAIMAFASILYARGTFRLAEQTWPKPLTEEKQKEKEKETKKEKKKEKKKA